MPDPTLCMGNRSLKLLDIERTALSKFVSEEIKRRARKEISRFFEQSPNWDTRERFPYRTDNR